MVTTPDLYDLSSLADRILRDNLTRRVFLATTTALITASLAGLAATFDV